MQLLTFGQAKKSLELKAVSGVCSDGEQFRSWVNEAVGALMTRGNFWGTVQRLRMCSYDNCIVWPRFVGTPLAFNTCPSQIPVTNHWYSFLPISRSDFGDSAFQVGHNRCWGNIMLENSDGASVFYQVPCGLEPYVRVYPMTRNDIGKSITLFGIDFNGQPIRTKDANGVYQDGVVLTLAVPYVSTPFTLRRLDRVVKDATEMPINLFYYDAEHDALLNCATYDPTELSPLYRTSRILMGHRNHNKDCDGAVQIDALVKLTHIPVEADTDLVQISNLRAVKKMIQAIRQEEEGETDMAAKMELSAVRELNLELRDKFPLDQVPIDIESFGLDARPARHMIGHVY